MWSEGEVILPREVLNDGRPWMEGAVIVVRDDEELLATYIAEGAVPLPCRPVADGERAPSLARQAVLAWPRRSDAATARRGACGLGLLAGSKA